MAFRLIGLIALGILVSIAFALLFGARGSGLWDHAASGTLIGAVASAVVWHKRKRRRGERPGSA